VSELEPGFRPREGWVNDPHGVCLHEGRYHLFFQHVPGSSVWQPWVSWGHATSPDLETWTEQPVALAPDADDVGCWSGCLVPDGPGGPRIFYTSVAGDDLDRGRIRSAVPLDDGWTTWRKGDVDLVVPDDALFFRDPFVLRDGDGWRMLVGAGLADGVGAVLTYVSTDLVAWTYDGVLAQRPDTEHAGDWTGRVWECPQLVEVDGRHVLMVSVHDGRETRHVSYAVGELAAGRFEAGPWHRLADGAPYAATTFQDADGRATLMAWLRGGTGVLSAPYLLAREGDRLVLTRRPPGP
jgi:beta-fructofuranosidase